MNAAPKSKIVLAGGTGFVGRYVSNLFSNDGNEVVLIARQPNSIPWEDHESIVKALEGAQLLLNLAGKSVNCRYSKANQEAILRSRTDTTNALGRALLQCHRPPPLWINSSTATIYRHAEDRPMTESEGEIGSGFSVGIAKQWEESFFRFTLHSTRRVALRMAIVLGKGGGVVPPIRTLVKLGLGGRQGTGEQKFSWIHIHDLYRIVLFVMKNEGLSGPVNCSSPNPVNNSTLMRAFRKALNVKVGVPLPKWMLEVGAALIRTETELVLKSRWVLPEKLLNAGFVFEYQFLETAVDQSLGRDRSEREVVSQGSLI